MKRSILGILIFGLALTGFSQEEKQKVDMTELAKKTQNPVESMIQLPLGYYGNINWGPGKQFSSTLELKPVIPVKLSKGLNLIFRLIIPVVFLPAPVSKTGLTDIQLQLYLAPSKTKKFIWGVGPMISFPTGAPYELCSGKWTAGPIGVGLFMLKHWVVGALVNQRWSFAGDGSMPDINQLYINAFANYNFKHGWAISYAPEIYANWNLASNQVWTVPVGLAGIKAFHIGKQMMSANLGFYYNVVRPTDATEMYVKAAVSLLFPK
ncbi:MAG TPA: hypothetical protein PKN44_16040 [Bacteroidales bacterium]|nr:hypothetical protein [Bacteroidales bacterium]